MLESLVQAFRIPELKKRIQFVLAMFAIFVIGAHIPVPGVDHKKVEALFGQGGLLGLVDVFSGGALRRMSVFAMGIIPYINASIIMQMLTLAIPQLEAMQKEGEAGRKRIAKITRYLTIGLAFFQSLGHVIMFRSSGVSATLLGTLQMCIALTAGTCFLLWIGEQITEKGIGNGVSLVIFAGIMTSMPYQTSLVVEAVRSGINGPLNVIMLLALFVGTILGIVYVTQGQRKIPIQHVKRVVGMRVTPGGSSFLPIKVNTAGVIPIIFAISMVMFPAQILNAIPSAPNSFLSTLKSWANLLYPGNSYTALVIYALLIVIFTYFYTAVVMNVQDMADNLKKYGNYIPGIRPGKPTFDYLDRVVSRITLAGAIFLAAVALVQYIAPQITGFSAATFGLIGGTSLLIVVGVAIETMQAIEAQLLMRNYEGFIRQSGIG